MLFLEMLGGEADYFLDKLLSLLTVL